MQINENQRQTADNGICSTVLVPVAEISAEYIKWGPQKGEVSLLFIDSGMKADSFIMTAAS